MGAVIFFSFCRVSMFRSSSLEKLTMGFANLCKIWDLGLRDYEGMGCFLFVYY